MFTVLTRTSGEMIRLIINILGYKYLVNDTRSVTRHKVSIRVISKRPRETTSIIIRVHVLI